MSLGSQATAIGEVFMDGEEARELVVAVYTGLKEAGLIVHSVDSIAYTDDFERVYQRVSRHFPMSRNEVACILMNARKRGEAKAP